MIGIVAWIFTLGGIMGFLSMMLHSLIHNSKKTTLFIFCGGTLISYLLEYTLVEYFHQYSYQNLPLLLINIPIVIPMGWVVTFYGLLQISDDLTKNHIKSILLTGLLGIFFGTGIETLAKYVDFWVFYFEFKLFMGIPLTVLLAWGLSTSAFASGVKLYEKYQNKYLAFPALLLIVHVVNIGIAIILST